MPDLKERIRKHLDKMAQKFANFDDLEIMGNIYLDATRDAILAEVKGIVPEEKSCTYDWHNRDCDCIEFESYNACRTELLRRME